MQKGYLLFVLNAHLPFVRHPSYESFVEESWLNEAIAETYLPLLRVFNRLEADHVPFCVTIAISPTLASMLNDELLQERFIKYLDNRIDLGEKEVERTSFDPVFRNLAEMYLENYRTAKKEFVEDYRCNILKRFRELEKAGRIVIMTTAATHSFLPFYTDYPNALEAQVQTAVISHSRIFGKEPSGFWLPELGYAPGIESVLKSNNIKYFFSSVHSFLFAAQKPEYGVYAPANCGGIAAFGRDLSTSMALWSYDEGYPGSRVYREFYRDISFDLPEDYLSSILYEGGIRVNSGYKYYANTGKPKEEKKPYSPDDARIKIEEHAENFIYNLKKQIKKISSHIDRPPVVVCPVDAQVFGHWWYEGPLWLEKVIRTVHGEDIGIEPVTAESYLEKYPENQKLDLSFSSWGNNGYARVWLNGSNDWIYRHLHSLVDKMAELVRRFPDEKGLKERALNQAAREVLLSQASDWPFIMTTGIAEPYAIKRVREHIHNFLVIYDNLCRNTVDTEWLTNIEKKNNLFPDIDYRIFADTADD